MEEALQDTFTSRLGAPFPSGNGVPERRAPKGSLSAFRLGAFSVSHKAWFRSSRTGEVRWARHSPESGEAVSERPSWSKEET
jgi:hypothetical protein